MRFLLVLVIVLAAQTADARPMQHFDLAGLAAHSDSIVVATRIKTLTPEQFSRIGVYRVERTIRGPLQPGNEVKVEEFLYATEGHTLDAQVVLFLNNGSLLPSGLRVVEGGKVFRFEQWNNPGGWTMVPQGSDPQDQWQARPSVDLATFERQIAAAIARADMFRKASALTDRDRRRAALLALFVPPGGPKPFGGFYQDVLAQEAEQLLVKAGDVEGALLVFERDRSRFPPFGLATLAELLPIAKDTTKPVNLRVAALRVIASSSDMIGGADPTHTVIALVDDPLPAIREAAIAAIAPRGAMSSDPQQNSMIKKLEREQRTALAKRWAAETDPGVLFALLDAIPGPRKGGPDLVARVVLQPSVIVQVQCVRPKVTVTKARLIATQAGKAASIGGSRVEFHCGGGSTPLDSTQAATTPAGRYDLALEATVGGKQVTQPLGVLVVSADGDVATER